MGEGDRARGILSLLKEVLMAAIEVVWNGNREELSSREKRR